jgi:hypothetical protein
MELYFIITFPTQYVTVAVCVQISHDGGRAVYQAAGGVHKVGGTPRRADTQQPAHRGQGRQAHPQQRLAPPALRPAAVQHQGDGVEPTA